MGLFEQSLSDQGVDPDIPSFVQPSGVYFKDADTFVTPDGKTVRLINSNAYETQKTGRTADAFSPAQTGADEQLIIARKVAADGGYNTPVLTGKKDIYGREIGDLQNSKGELLSNYLVGNRLVDTMMPDDNILTVRAVADLNKARDKGFGLAPTLADQYLSALNDVRHQDRLTAKVYANSAKQYGASLDPRGNSDVYTGAAEVQSDEDYKGDARSNLRTGFNSGYNQMMQGAWNGLDILGHITHQKGWEEKGQEYSRMYQNNLENLPNLRNGEAFDENGNWKLDSFSKLADYTVATAASSSPQMILGIAATLAAPVTFGASVAAPAVVFAGQTWQHQKVKDPAWAIASGVTQAVLETLGVERITGSIFHKATQEQVVKQLVRKGYTKEAAEQAIIAKSGKALADISDFAKAAMVKDATDAAMQLEKISVRSVGKAMLQGAIAEPVTESLQEVTQYFGEQSGFNLPTDEHGQNVLKNRVLNSAVGGLVLGGAFGGAGRVLANATNGRDIKPTEDVDLRKKITEQFSYVPAAEELGKDALNDVRNKDLHAKDLSLDELAQGEMSKRSASGLVGTVGNWWRDKGFSSLYDKWSNTLKGSDTNGNYSNALWTLLGSSRAFSGGSIEEQQAHTNQELQNTFGSPEQIRNAFGTKSLNEVNGILMNPKVKATVAAVLNIMSSRNKTAVQAADMLADIDKLDGDLVKHSAGVLHYAQKVNDLLLAYNKKTGQNLDHEQFLTLSPVNRTAIQRHPSNFSSLLVQHLGIGKQEADEITTRFTTDADMQMITDPFEEMFNPNHKAQKTLTELNKLMVKSPGVFAKYLHQSPVENAYALAAKGAATFVHKDLIGPNGAHLAALLQMAQHEGELSPERASFVAKELRDWLDMRTGKYHEIKNQYYKAALATVNFLSTVSSLPLAAISSTVEFAQVYRNLNLPQSLKATKHLLKGFGAEMAGTITSMAPAGPPSKLVSDYRQQLFEAGFSHEGDIGRRLDVVSGYYQNWTEGFFKMTGLTSVTNVTRYAKLAIGADAIKSWLDTVQNGDINNPTQKEKDARDHLVRIGVDVDWIMSVDRKDPAIQERMEKEFSTGTHNFVTEAVIHPTKMNRPKFYNDPYLQLFTQFQGYVSAFTANVLPRLLGDLRKGGSDDQVNAAATIAMMFALAYFALYMKDLIKYGESPPPWLKDDDKFQRYIGQVGLLGTSQRIVDAVSPITPQDQRQHSVFAKAYNAISDQAPALSYLNKINDALSAQPGSQTKQLVRTLPVFGTSPAFAKYLQKELGDI